MYLQQCICVLVYDGTTLLSTSWNDKQFVVHIFDVFPFIILLIAEGQTVVQLPQGMVTKEYHVKKQ